MAPRRGHGRGVAVAATLLVALMLAVGAAPAMAADTAGSATTVWLLRHAEAGEGPDPSLSAAGRARADAWHGELGAPVLQRVYATDTRRSRETAAAIAADAGAEVELYDPAEPGALIRVMVQRNEPAVVVAHSNTLNPLAGALGAGSDLEEIGHDEHGRVYRVELPPSSQPSPASGRGGAARPGEGVQLAAR